MNFGGNWAGAFVADILVIVGFLFLFWIPWGTWINGFFSGVRVNPVDLMFMKIRGVSPEMIVRALIQAKNSNLNISLDALEAHFLAGGHVELVVSALIQALKARIPLDFSRACAIDLAGRDVLEAVNMCVNPKVIKTSLIGAVAKDGIQLKAMARITVKADIKRLIGGAGEATVIARVGEGICTTIGSDETHKSVLESPMSISDSILAKGLDTGTAFEILSIDIADIDVGKNIGSELQIQQANADKNIAQARSEQRRSMAIAEEQEMKAKVVEMQGKVIAAEAEVPLSLAASLRNGIRTA